MLYWLLYQKLFPYFHPFRIFRYLTFRTAFATLTALLIGLLIGPFLIEKLREFQIGQYIREDGPQGHQKKAGTPTMGGVLICIAILVPTLLWSDLTNPFVWLAVLATVAFRRHRICRRLHQGRSQAKSGPDGPRQVRGCRSASRSLIAVLLLVLRRDRDIFHPADGAVCQAISAPICHRTSFCMHAASLGSWRSCRSSSSSCWCWSAPATPST